jgi:hypothetical protein
MTVRDGHVWVMLIVINPFLVIGVTGTLGNWHGWQPVARGQETTEREPVRAALVLAELSGWER